MVRDESIGQSTEILSAPATYVRTDQRFIKTIAAGTKLYHWLKEGDSSVEHLNAWILSNKI